MLNEAVIIKREPFVVQSVRSKRESLHTGVYIHTRTCVFVFFFLLILYLNAQFLS